MSCHVDNKEIKESGLKRNKDKTYKSIIRTSATTRINPLDLTLLARARISRASQTQPPIRIKLRSISTPKRLILVQCADSQNHSRALGYDVSLYRCGTGGDAEGQCDWRIQPQNFETEGVEVGDVVDDVGGDRDGGGEGG